MTPANGNEDRGPTSRGLEGPTGAGLQSGPRAARPGGGIRSGARGRLAVPLVAGDPVGGEARLGAEPLHPLLVLRLHGLGLGLALIADVVAVGGEERGERRGDAAVERQDVVGRLRLVGRDGDRPFRRPK